MLHLPGACVVAELFLGRSELIWSRANSTPAAQKAVAAHTVLRVCVDMTGGLLKGTLSSFVFSKSVISFGQSHAIRPWKFANLT